MFIALEAATSCSGVVLAFRASQAALKSALAVTRSWDEPMGSSPPEGDGDIPQPVARQALDDKADSADALPAFEHSVVTEVDGAHSGGRWCVIFVWPVPSVPPLYPLWV
jgi:hypothetical protein